MPKLNALVAGSTGYIGVQLIKILVKHKFINIRFLCGNSSVGKNISSYDKSLTGKKFQDKKYYRHTGHPGGIKETTPEKLHEKKPGETLKLAVKRMLPGGVLGRKQLTKLKIYSGSDHPHAAQNPQVIELGKLNSKNLARN
jgi:large subunit ribosomal protein L13